MNHRAVKRAVSLSLIRQLRALRPESKPRRRVGRWPKPLPPTNIEKGYTTAVKRAVCALARACFDREAPEILHALVSLRRSQGKLDARAPGRGAAIGAGRAAQLGKAEAEAEDAKQREQAGRVGADLRRGSEQGKRAAAAIDRAARAFVEEFRPHALHAVVAQFGTATDTHSRQQLDRQLRSAIGVPLSALERPHRDKLEGWAALNVDLIKTVPERYFDRIRLDILEAFDGGTHPATLAEQFAERYEMSENDAERVARDQVLSLSADLNHDRMEALGVERATWRTMQDGRVCEICEAREGVSFAMDEGIDGELPGDCHPMDRCYSEPDLEALING